MSLRENCHCWLSEPYPVPVLFTLLFIIVSWAKEW